MKNAVFLIACALMIPVSMPQDQFLLRPDALEMNRQAPGRFVVTLETSKGKMVMELQRAWAPLGVDRFYNLAAHGYYDGTKFFRVVKDKWAQFGINGDPKIATLWRSRTIPDDPLQQTNARGAVAFAFAVPNGRTTQLFINLRDNAATHDKEFVPIGRIIDGMEVADALFSEYGENAGGGIRGGKQDPLFTGGNAYLEREFPRLDYIKKAVIK